MEKPLYFKGRKYISARRAAALVEYTSDYVGQLCRTGKIESTLVGRNWYVSEASIIKHKETSHLLPTKAGRKRGPRINVGKPKDQPKISIAPSVEKTAASTTSKNEIYSPVVAPVISQKNVSNKGDFSELKLSRNFLRNVKNVKKIEEKEKAKKFSAFKKKIAVGVLSVFLILFSLGLWDSSHKTSLAALTANERTQHSALALGSFGDGLVAMSDWTVGVVSKILSPWLQKDEVKIPTDTTTTSSEPAPSSIVVNQYAPNASTPVVVSTNNIPSKAITSFSLGEVKSYIDASVDSKFETFRQQYLTSSLLPNINRTYIDKQLDSISRSFGSSGGSSSSASSGIALTDLSASAPITYNSTTGGFGFDFSTNNSWTGLNQFHNASTTLLSANIAAFGGTATSSFDNAGILTLANVTGCLQADGSGVVSGTGVNCGSGGTGGGSWSTTTSSVANENINYSNNATDIVAIGGSSTSTAKFYFDPNRPLAWLNQASSTLISANTGYFNVVNATSSSPSTFSGGLLSTASTTIVGNATTTGSFGAGSIFVNNDLITDFTGSGITNTGGALGVNLSAFTTDNLPQGSTNLYWSNTLFDNRLSATSSISGITTLPNLSLPATQLTSFGTPFYQFFSATNTDALAEGSVHKYYSNAQVDAHISGTYPVQYSSGIISLAFGTTTNNNWSGANVFQNASTTIVGGLTIGGNATVTNATTTGALSVGGVLAVAGNSTSTFSNGVQATYLNITGTSATSTFANGINLSSGCFSINGTCVSGSTGSSSAFPFTVNTGYNSTSTTIGFTGGLFSTASSTFSSSLYLPSLSQGFAYLGSAGQVNTIASSSVKLSWFNNDAGFTTYAFPFTSNTGYNSTSTTLGLLNGFFSTASSTVSGSFHLNALSNGELAVFGGLVSSGATTTPGTGLTYSGNAFNVNTTQNISTLSNLTSNGLVYTAGGAGTLNTAATGTISCTGTASCGAGSSVIGSNLTITGTGLASYDAWTHPAAGISATTSQVTVAGLLSTASSTFSSALRLSSLAQGFDFVGSGGLISTVSSSTLAAQVFPFTSNTGYNSTSTVLGLNGFFSTASSTQSGNFFLPSLAQGFSYTGTNGQVNTIASSSVKLSWFNNDAGFLTSATGLTSYDAWTHPASGISATTSQVTVAGLLSTASSTFSSSLYLPSLSQGFAYLGSAGQVNTIASSSVKLSWFNNDAGFLTSALQSYDAFTHPTYGGAATTSLLTLSNGFLSTASSTIVADATTTGMFSVGTRLHVDSAGFGTTTVTGLAIAGSATSTSNVGLDFSGGNGGINTNFLYGAGLATCNTNTDKIIWANGKFSCGIDQSGTGSGGGSWATTTSSVPGQLINYSLNATDVIAIGGSSTTTGKFWFDPNTQISYLGGNVGVGSTSPWAQLSVNSSAATTAFVVGSSTATSFIVDKVGNVGVGTALPTEALSINSGNLLLSQGSNLKVKSTLTDATNLAGAKGVYVSGHYAYVAAPTNSRLTVVDISNPNSFAVVGSVSDATNLAGSRSVFVSGKYAYVAAPTNNRLTVVDVSNPASPSVVGSISDVTLLAGIQSVYVSGKYAYVAAQNTDRMSIVDISNPSNMSVVGSVNDGTHMAAPTGVYVSGHYAYVSALVSNSVSAVDVSNPKAPFIASTAIDNTNLAGASGVYVSGKYAYVSAETGNRLAVVNVANPTSITYVNSITDPILNGAESVYVSGHYAYVTSINATGKSLAVINVSNPSNLSISGSIQDTTNLNGPYSLFVSGKYAYVAAATNNSLTEVDIAGADVPVANIGNLAANDITASENIDVGNNLNVRNALNVGEGGILEQGTLAINIATSTDVAAFTITASTSNSNILAVRTSGNVGIGTSSPAYELQISTSSTNGGFKPQLTLSDQSAASNQKHWNLSSLGGNLYFGTSTDLFATTSQSALTVSGTGFGTTTVIGLNIQGLATSTSNVGFNITSGCFAVGGACIGSGSLTSYDAWTHPAAGISATTSQLTVAGLLSTASSTFSNDLFLSSLAQGYSYVGTNGIIKTVSTSTLAAQVFPFTSNTGYNSTSTVLGLNGFFSTASSTQSGNFFLPSLAQGFSYTGTNGQVNTIASSSVKLSWFNNDAGFLTSATGLTSYDAWTHPFSASSATTSTIYLNTGGLDVTASTTIGSSLHLSSLSNGELAVFGGLVSSGATTTPGTGLTYSGNAFNVNTSQNITTLSNLTSNGLVYTAGGAGTLNTTATGTISCTGTASCGAGSSVIGSNLTITGTGLASYDAWTHPLTGLSATTSQLLIGTSTASNYETTISSSTAPQLSLSAGAGLSQFTFRNAGGTLYISTTTVAGNSTSTISALSINPNGQLTVPNLATAGFVKTDANGTFSVDTNVYDTFAFPFTVNTGYNSTSTTIGFTGGLFSTASSTFSSALRLSSLAQGFDFVGSGGLISTVSSSTLAAQVFPFTSNTGYNSTSTTLGLLNGFFSTASSTQSGNFFLPSLAQGFSYTGTNGQVNTIASSSVKLSWFNNDAGFTNYAFPFTVNTGYNSTSTTIGFLNGLFSTASSTFSNNVFFPNLTQGFAFIGTNGIHSTISTSTLASQVFTATTFAPNSIITTNASGNLIATGTQLTVGNIIATTTASSYFLGNVGIGTTTPEALVTIQGAGTGRVDIGQYTGDNSYGAISLNGQGLGAGGYNFTSGLTDGNLYINRPAGSDIRFNENNVTTNIVIKSGGNVGVGTTSPYAQLSVFAGGDYASHAPSTLFAVGSSTAGTATSTLLSVLSNGKVGIGVTNPARALDITDVTGTNQPQARFEYGSGSGAIEILGNSGSDQDIYFGTTASAQRGIIAYSNSTDAFNFSTGNTSTSRLNINSSGNVGIGTTTPTYLLNPSSATAPQLSLSAGAGLSQFTFRNAGGTLYISTTTVAGNSTSTISALSINPNGQLTVPNLATAGFVKTDANGTFSVDTNVYDTFAFPFTVNTGYNSTSTTIGFTGGLFSTASSTFSSALRLSSLAQGFDFVGSGGLISTISSSTLAAQVFPFTSNTGYNSTSTTLGLLNGFFSTASSTFNSNVFFPNLTQGFAYIGTNGIHSTISTSTLASQIFTATTFSPNSIITTNASGNLIATGTQLTVGNLLSTSTTATSTFLGGLQVGTSNLIVDRSTGNVGIGTTSASQALSVGGNAYITGNVLSGTNSVIGTGVGFSALANNNAGLVGGTFENNNSNGYEGFNYYNDAGTLVTSIAHSNSGASLNPNSTWIGTRNAEPLYLVTNGSSPRLTIDTVGNVGVGTTSPYAQLSVFGGGDYASHAASTLFAIGSSTAGTATSTLLSVLSNGNVGIGTAAPLDKLEIVGGGVTLQNGQGYSIRRSTGAVSINVMYIPAASDVVTISDGGNGINFVNTGAANLMTITNGGSVGIGTTTPYTRLNIASTTQPQLALTGSNTDNIWTERSIGNNFYIATASPTTYATSSVSALRIDSNGFLYSPTISAASGNNCLQVDTTGKVTNTGSACGSAAGLSSYDAWTHPLLGLSATTSQLLIGTSTASNYETTISSSTAPQLSLSAGAGLSQFTFRNAGGNLYISTTTVDGTATTTSPAFALSNSGKVGINTDSSAYQLNINAANNATGALSITGQNSSALNFTSSGGSGYFQFTAPTVTTNGLAYSFSGATSLTAGGQFFMINNTGANTVGSADLFQVRSSNTDRLMVLASGNIGVSTSTPAWLLQVSTSTASNTFKPQFALSDQAAGTDLKHWTLASEGGNFYIATATDLLATSSVSALRIDTNGKVIANCFSNDGSTCISGGGLSSYDAFTHPAAGQSATTSLMLFNGQASSTQLSANQAYFGGTATTTITNAGWVGIASSTPWGLLSVNPSALGSGVPEFVVGSSSATHFYIDGAGNVGIGTTSPIALLHLNDSGGTTKQILRVGPGNSSFTNPRVLGGKSTFGALNYNSDAVSIDDENSNSSNDTLALDVLSHTSHTSGTMANSRGIYVEAANTSGGTVTSLKGIETFVDNEGGSTASNMYGLFVSSNFNSSHTGNNYGIYVDDQSGIGAAGQNYQIYSAGSAPSYFAGNIGIASSTPWGQLSVNPNALGSGVPEFVVGSSSATHLIVNGAGNVGIGTSSPDQKLTVSASGQGITQRNGAVTLAMVTAASDGEFGTISNHALQIYANNGSGGFLVFNANGTMDFSHTSIASDFTPTNDNSNNLGQSNKAWGTAYVGTINTHGTDLNLITDASTENIISTISGTEKMRVTKSGVGVGTTTPYYGLTVASTTGAQLALSAGAGLSQFTFRNAGGNLYISTTTVAGTATTSTSILSFNGTTGGISISTSTVGTLKTSSNGLIWVDTSSGTAASSTLLGDFNTFSNTNNFTGKLGLASSTPWGQLSVNPNALGSGVPEFVVGSSSATHLIVDGSGAIGIGTSTPISKLSVVDSGNGTSTPIISLYNSNSSPALEIRTGGVGLSNTLIGVGVGKSVTIGQLNTALGYAALSVNTTGSSNVAIGDSALISNVAGQKNVAVGSAALSTNLNSDANTALGWSALGASDSFNNTAVGYCAGCSVSSGQNNTLFGYNAGSSVNSGANNILLGYQAGDAITSGSNNIILGYDIDAASSTGSNQLAIGNLIFGTGLNGTANTLSNGSIGIGTSTPNQLARLTLASTTASQLALEGSNTDNIWTLRSIGSAFYLATASPTTFATSSVSALRIDTNGKVIANCFSNDGSTCITAGAGGNPGGSGTEIQYRSGASTFGAVSSSAYNSTANFLGLGTTTPAFLLNLATSTGPQLALTGSGANTFTFREAGGNLYIATSSATTFATTSNPVMTLDTKGDLLLGTTSASYSPGTFTKVLTVNGYTPGNDSGLSNIELVGNRSGGRSVFGAITGMNGTSATPATQIEFDNSAGAGPFGGDIVFSTNDGTTLNKIVRIDRSGNFGLGLSGLILPSARLDIAGKAGANNVLDVSSSTGTSILRVSYTSQVGIASTTPWGLLSVNPNALGSGVPEFVVGSSSATHLLVDGGGKVLIGASSEASGFGPNLYVDTHATGGGIVIANLTGGGVTAGLTLSGDRSFTFSTQGSGGTDDRVALYEPASSANIAGFWRDNGGELSVGNFTTNPSTKLKVFGTAGTPLFDLASSTATSVVRVDAFDKTGFASTTPWGQLSVNPNALGSGVPEFVVGSSSATHLVVDGTGRVGVGTTTPIATFFLEGQQGGANSGSGTITRNSPGALTGSGTSFLSQLHLGDEIYVASTLEGIVNNITDNINANTSPFNSTVSAQSFQYIQPAFEAYNASTTAGIILSRSGYTNIGNPNFGFANNSTLTVSDINSPALANPSISGTLTVSSNGSSNGNYIFVTKSGAGLFDITNAGRVGVATDTPWALLSVNPSALGSGVPEFVVGSSSATHLVVDGGGKVGIGTTNPVEPFEVKVTAGPHYSAIFQDGLGATAFGSGAAGFGAFQSIQSYTDDSMSQVASMALNPLGGHVSIGGGLGGGSKSGGVLEISTTTAPTGYGLNDMYVVVGGAESVANHTDLIGLGFNNTGDVNVPSYMGYLTTDTTSFEKGALVFGTRDVTTDTQPTERLRIDTTGNIGIATTSPKWKLSVASTTMPQVALLGNDTDNIWTERSIGNNFYIATASPTTYATSSVSALRIDTNGKVIANCFSNDGSTCITAGAGGNPGGSGTEIQYRSGASTFGAVSSSAYNSTANFLGLGTTTPAFLLNLATSTGPQLALTGTGANTFTFREAGGNLYIATSSATTFATTSNPVMTLDTKGDLLLGTTSSSYTPGTFTRVLTVNGYSPGSDSGLSDIELVGNRSIGRGIFGAITGMNGTSATPATQIEFDNSAGAGPFGGDIVFSTNDGTTLNKIVRIDRSGNFGLGLSGLIVPSARLDIAGKAGANNVLDVSSSTGTSILRVSYTSQVGIASTTPWGLLSVNPNALGSGVPELVVGSSSATHLIVDGAGNVGIGTSAPISKLTVEGTITGTGANAIAGIYGTSTLNANTNGGFLFGDRFLNTVGGTASSTVVGTLIRMTDNTSFDNTTRGLEVQAYSGNNTLGVNEGIVTFGKTFGLHAYTDGLAGAIAQPAAVFAELGHPTSGNAIRAYTATATTATLVSIYQETSAFTGTGLAMDLGNGSGGSFGSGSFIDLKNQGTSKFQIKSNGFVGIGTTTPHLLTVASTTATQDAVFDIYAATSTGSATSTIGFFVSTTTGMTAGVGLGLPSALSNYIIVGNGKVQAGMAIVNGGICVDNDGWCTASTTGRISSVTSTVGSTDVAEIYNSTDNLQPGDIVSATLPMNSVKLADPATDAQKVMGIVSTDPGLILGLRPGEDATGTQYAIALAGRVPVKVSLENGPIAVGDYLTLSSTTPGVAVKATQSGNVLGLALNSYDSNSTSGKVMTFVHLGWQNISSGTTQVAIGSTSTTTSTTSTTTSGQLTGNVSNPQTGTASTTTIVGNLVVNQNGSGNILQLQSGSQDRFLVADSGMTSILAVATDTDNVFRIANNGSDLVTINGRGDISYKGVIVAQNDSFAGSIATDGTSGLAEVTFQYNVGTGKPVVELTAEGDIPTIAQITSWKTDSLGNYTGFFIKSFGTNGQAVGANIHYLVTAKENGYATAGNAYPVLTNTFDTTSTSGTTSTGSASSPQASSGSSTGSTSSPQATTTTSTGSTTSTSSGQASSGSTTTSTSTSTTLTDTTSSTSTPTTTTATTDTATTGSTSSPQATTTSVTIGDTSTGSTGSPQATTTSI